MVEILALVMFHDEKVVLEAVKQALKAGAPSKQIILNMLSRLLGGALPPRIDAPQALSLKVEPQADVGRYDQLRNRSALDAA
jgi:hypothetical protein